MICIAPPFGSYFRPRGTLPVIGSFTLEARSGRTGQILRTFRPVSGGWVNAIGLRNPGLTQLEYKPGVVFSLAGIDDGDWEKMYAWLYVQKWPAYAIELNLSCPNIEKYGHPWGRKTIELFTELPNALISAKLPPTDAVGDLVEICLEAGIRYIHLSNTLPSLRGGISGDQLRAVNLPIVEHIAREFPEVQIIAGGGIYTAYHARQYRDAGAKHLSLGTVFMNPIRGWRLAKWLVANQVAA